MIFFSGLICWATKSLDRLWGLEAIHTDNSYDIFMKWSSFLNNNIEKNNAFLNSNKVAVCIQQEMYSLNSQF